MNCVKANSLRRRFDSGVGSWCSQFWRRVSSTRVPSSCFAGAIAYLTNEGPAHELNQVSTHDPTELSLKEPNNIVVDFDFAASCSAHGIAPASTAVSIVTANEINVFGYRSLAGVLQGMRDRHVSNDRNRFYSGLRGFLRRGASSP